MPMDGCCCRILPYEEGSRKKQLFWFVHSVLIGIAAVPIHSIVGPLVFRGAIMATGIVTGFTVVAVSAPSKKFLETAGPAGIVLGAVGALSIGTSWPLKANSQPPASSVIAI